MTNCSVCIELQDTCFVVWATDGHDIPAYYWNEFQFRMNTTFWSLGDRMEVTTRSNEQNELRTSILWSHGAFLHSSKRLFMSCQTKNIKPWMKIGPEFHGRWETLGWPSGEGNLKIGHPYAHHVPHLPNFADVSACDSRKVALCCSNICHFYIKTHETQLRKANCVNCVIRSIRTDSDRCLILWCRHNKNGNINRRGTH